MDQLKLRDIRERATSDDDLYALLMAAGVKPVAGGDGSDGDDKGGGGDGDQTAAAETAKAAEEAEAAAAAADEKVELTRAEHDKLTDEVARQRRKIAEDEQKRRDDEKQRKREQTELAKKEGRWQELAEEEKGNRETVEKERDEARQELTSFKRELMVSRIATRLRWQDPGDAHLYLSHEDTEDEQLTEAALKRVAKEKQYLVQEPPKTGTAINGGQATGLSAEQEHTQFLQNLLGGAREQ